MKKIKNTNKAELTLLIFSLAFLLIAVILPMALLFGKAFSADDGTFVGLANFQEYFSSPNLVSSFWNSLAVSTLVAAVTSLLSFTYAYSLTRTDIPLKKFFRFTAMLPLFAPSMMFGIALIYLIGNKGLLTMAGLKLPLYGAFGIIVSEIIYTFPQAVLIMYVTLSYSDNRLYEAARVMGAGSARIFRTITVPGAKFGIISAFLVSFTLCFSDFGAPKIVGGNYNVLATDIYKQIIGQQNFKMGAVVGILLMIPAIVMFITERVTSSENNITVSSRSMSYRIIPDKRRDLALTSFCAAVSFVIMLLFGTVLMASLIKAWPYNMELTLANFTVDSPATGGISSFKNSIITAVLSAVLGTAFVFVNAWLIEKVRGYKLLKQIDYLFSIVPLALPGLSIGLAFIFFSTWKTTPLTVFTELSSFSS